MKKIITLFERNRGDWLVSSDVVPGAEWVIEGKGVATRKYDGTCCMVRDGVVYKRHEVKKGKTPPEGFEPACEVDPVTGKQQGWIAIGDGPEDQWHRQASRRDPLGRRIRDGTYELCGPKIQGNPEPEKPDSHWLIPHGHTVLEPAPRTFEELRTYFAEHDIEGIVWHHPDGRMVKIKGRDFGINRTQTKGN